MTTQAQIGFGQVHHSRLRPTRNAFTYPTFFLLLPLRSLSQKGAKTQSPTASTEAAADRRGWRINQRHCISFRDTDHGDGRTPEQGGAIGWIDGLLRDQGISDATGEVWLHCYPRVLGFTFKPVSFWYCHRAADDQNGALRAIVVEVNNTFGERHCYLLEAPRFDTELRTDKVFHVSPFNSVRGHYRFRFARNALGAAPHTAARIDYWDDDGADAPLLQTSIHGALEPVTAISLRRALWRFGAMTLLIVLRIHLQALRLWWKKVPFFRKPEPPEQCVTR